MLWHTIITVDPFENPGFPKNFKFQSVSSAMYSKLFDSQLIPQKCSNSLNNLLWGGWIPSLASVFLFFVVLLAIMN